MNILNVKWLRVVLFIFLSPLSLLLVIFGISQLAPSKPPSDFLVTHNFFDLAQIDSFYKYRSCAGHQTVPQYTDEVSRMDHGFTRIQSTEPDQLKIYAPFDGYVTNIMTQGISMVSASSKLPWWPFNQWRINMPHTHPLPEYEKAATFVKAGTLIGYADYEGEYDKRGQKNRGAQVEIGVIAIPPQFKNGNGEPWKKLDSIFRYMSDEVFTQYQTAIPGLKSREDLIFSKEYRQDYPCKFKGNGPYFDSQPEEHTVYLGLDINIKDREKILRRSLTGPDGILNAGETCESLNNKFRGEDGSMFICTKQNDQMIWIDYAEE